MGQNWPVLLGQSSIALPERPDHHRKSCEDSQKWLWLYVPRQSPVELWSPLLWCSKSCHPHVLGVGLRDTGLRRNKLDKVSAISCRHVTIPNVVSENTVCLLSDILIAGRITGVICTKESVYRVAGDARRCRLGCAACCR